MEGEGQGINVETGTGITTVLNEALTKVVLTRTFKLVPVGAPLFY